MIYEYYNLDKPYEYTAGERKFIYDGRDVKVMNNRGEVTSTMTPQGFLAVAAEGAIKWLQDSMADLAVKQKAFNDAQDKARHLKEEAARLAKNEGHVLNKIYLDKKDDFVDMSIVFETWGPKLVVPSETYPDIKVTADCSYTGRVEIMDNQDGHYDRKEWKLPTAVGAQERIWQAILDKLQSAVSTRTASIESTKAKRSFEKQLADATGMVVSEEEEYHSSYGRSGRGYNTHHTVVDLGNGIKAYVGQRSNSTVYLQKIVVKADSYDQHDLAIETFVDNVIKPLANISDIRKPKEATA